MPLLRGFVAWAVSHGYMVAGLEVPWHSSREKRRVLDDEDRIVLAGRLLRDQDKEPRDRLGAVLILLFGQSAARLARLRASAVSRDDDGRVYLALGETPVRLREPLAHLAVNVADSARRSGSPWLFPGESGPMSSDQFRRRLTRAGVSSVLLARNSARASLAADVPPALLADKLGLSINAAVAWSKAVGAARADYVGLRNGPAPVGRKRGQALPLALSIRPRPVGERLPHPTNWPRTPGTATVKAHRRTRADRSKAGLDRTAAFRMPRGSAVLWFRRPAVGVADAGRLGQSGDDRSPPRLGEAGLLRVLTDNHYPVRVTPSSAGRHLRTAPCCRLPSQGDDGNRTVGRATSRSRFARAGRCRADRWPQSRTRAATESTDVAVAKVSLPSRSRRRMTRVVFRSRRVYRASGSLLGLGSRRLIAVINCTHTLRYRCGAVGRMERLPRMPLGEEWLSENWWP